MNITKFNVEDGSDDYEGLFALSFTIEIHNKDGTCDTYKHYFVPGAKYIETMDTQRPQYYFQKFTV